MTHTAKLHAALTAIDQGWSVFPLIAGRKTPAVATWEASATTDPERVTRWWTRRPTDNIGIACGPSRLVVIDLDTPKPGQTPPAHWTTETTGADVLAALADDHDQAVPATYTVRTGRNGRHLYYRAPAGLELRNTAGRIGWLIDTRAAGGYVVAAGSTVDGRHYTVEHGRHLPVMPDWLTSLSAPPQPASRPKPTRTTRRAQGYADAALDAELHRVACATPGIRNWALNKAAWNLSPYIAAGHLDRTTVEHDLQAVGEAIGLTPAEAGATVRSALDTGTRRHPKVAS